VIYLRRSGSQFGTGSGDLSYLQHIATTALDRGETVELQIEHGPWRPVTTAAEVSEVLHELFDELDAHRDAHADAALPLPFGDAP
jgi:hypothetical protein